MINNDRPITLNEKTDLLGTSIYVDMLKEEIEKSINDGNIDTIALFGPWGIGKSSIIKTVEEKLMVNKEENKINFKYYNAWKYSSDDFDRGFLTSINGDLEEELYTDITSQQTRFNNSSKGYYGLIIIIFIILFLFIFDSNNESNYSNSIIIKIVECFVMYFLYKVFIQQSFTKNKVFSFQDLSNIFNKEMSKKKYNTVFVVDDLDRCSYQKSINILESINGLTKDGIAKNYIFLIPIDKDRISKALYETRKYDEYEINNYFIKIFDSQITIDSLGNNNIHSMIEDVCKTQKIRISKRSINLLAEYCVNTPRNIIKTINDLNDEFCLINQKKEFRNIQKRPTHDEIVKLYILKQKWPSIYKRLCFVNNPTGINNIFNEIVMASNDDLLRSFKNLTSDISLSKIKEYSNLRIDSVFYDEEIAEKILNNDFSFNFNNEETISKSYFNIYKSKITKNELYDNCYEELLYSYLYLLLDFKDGKTLNRYIPIKMICNDFELYAKNRIEYKPLIRKKKEIEEIMGKLINVCISKKSIKKNIIELTKTFIKCKEITITIIALNNLDNLGLEKSSCQNALIYLVNIKDKSYDLQIKKLFASKEFFNNYVDERIINYCAENTKYLLIEEILENKKDIDEKTSDLLISNFIINKPGYYNIYTYDKSSRDILITEFKILNKMVLSKNESQIISVGKYIDRDTMKKYVNNCKNNNKDYLEYINTINTFNINYLKYAAVYSKDQIYY